MEQGNHSVENVEGDKKEEQSSSPRLLMVNLHLNEEDQKSFGNGEVVDRQVCYCCTATFQEAVSSNSGITATYLKQRDLFTMMPVNGVQTVNGNNKHWLSAFTMSSLPNIIKNI